MEHKSKMFDLVIENQRGRSHMTSARFCQIPKVEDMSLNLMKDIVVNLTDQELSKGQIFAFYLFHKFAPSPSLPDLSQFQNDILES